MLGNMTIPGCRVYNDKLDSIAEYFFRINDTYVFNGDTMANTVWADPHDQRTFHMKDTLYAIFIGWRQEWVDASFVWAGKDSVRAWFTSLHIVNLSSNKMKEVIGHKRQVTCLGRTGLRHNSFSKNRVHYLTSATPISII